MTMRGPENSALTIAPFPEAPSPTALKPIEQLMKLTAEELCAYIRGPLLDAENEIYTKERNTGLHKLVFLVGGTHKDIRRVRDSHGNSVYANPSKYAKAPEIIEAIVAASDFTDERVEDPTKFCSELSDVIYNLTLLTVLDKEAKLPYNHEEVAYEDCIMGLVRSLNPVPPEEGPNFEVRDLLLVSAIKYTKRLGDGKKDTHEEDQLIKELIDNSVIPYPTRDQVGRAYGALNIIGDRILLPRLNHLAEEEGWNLSVSSRSSNNIFK